MSTALPQNCLLCAHFQITWDPAAPRGCRAFGFKCRELPSAVVQRASGLPCQQFAPKTATAENRAAGRQ